MAQIKKWQAELQAGLKTVNEIRTKEMNEAPFPGEEFDKPFAQSAGAEANGSELSPFFTQPIEERK